jgi:hypothetical protein
LNTGILKAVLPLKVRKEKPTMSAATSTPAISKRNFLEPFILGWIGFKTISQYITLMDFWLFYNITLKIIEAPL